MIAASVDVEPQDFFRRDAVRSLRNGGTVTEALAAMLNLHQIEALRIIPFNLKSW